MKKIVDAIGDLNSENSEIMEPSSSSSENKSKRSLRKRKLDLNNLSSCLRPPVCQHQHWRGPNETRPIPGMALPGPLWKRAGPAGQVSGSRRTPMTFPTGQLEGPWGTRLWTRSSFAGEARRSRLVGQLGNPGTGTFSRDSLGDMLRCPVCDLHVSDAINDIPDDEQVESELDLDSNSGTSSSNGQNNSSVNENSEPIPSTSIDPCASTSTSEPAQDRSEIPDPQSVYQRHVDDCLRNAPPPGNHDDSDLSDLDVDVDGQGDFEEYTWAGQTRVRATSLIEGGLRDAPGFLTIQRGDEDEELDIEVIN